MTRKAEIGEFTAIELCFTAPSEMSALENKIQAENRLPRRHLKNGSQSNQGLQT